MYDTINAAFFGNRLPALEDIEISLAPRAFNRYSYNPEANTVMIGAGLLNASLEVVAILVYRLAVYVNCNQNHVDPTCSGGRYHNRVFQRMAEAAGFTVEHNRSVGYGILTPDEDFAVTMGYDGSQMAAMFLPTELLPVKSAKAPNERIRARIGGTQKDVAALHILENPLKLCAFQRHTYFENHAKI